MLVLLSFCTFPDARTTRMDLLASSQGGSLHQRSWVSCLLLPLSAGVNVGATACKCLYFFCFFLLPHPPIWCMLFFYRKSTTWTLMLVLLSFCSHEGNATNNASKPVDDKNGHTGQLARKTP